MKVLLPRWPSHMAAGRRLQFLPRGSPCRVGLLESLTPRLSDLSKVEVAQSFMFEPQQSHTIIATNPISYTCQS